MLGARAFNINTSPTSTPQHPLHNAFVSFVHQGKNDFLCPPDNSNWLGLLKRQKREINFSVFGLS